MKKDDRAKEERFYEGNVRPEEMPVFSVPHGEHLVPILMVEAGLAKTYAEGRKLMENSSVSFDGRKVKNHEDKVAVTGEHLLRAGKKNFAKIAAT